MYHIEHSMHEVQTEEARTKTWMMAWSSLVKKCSILKLYHGAVVYLLRIMYQRMKIKLSNQVKVVWSEDLMATKYNEFFSGFLHSTTWHGW